jgi:hypothetical protein
VFDKITNTLAAVIILLIVGFFGMRWIANRVLGRPNRVASNATFLWAPAVGFPGGLPRRGWWLSCSENAGHDICKLSSIDGITEYEGEFLSYPDGVSLPSDHLQVDAEKTTEYKLWIGKTLVPLVHLTNGKILIPSKEYEEGVRLLQRP